MLKAASAITYEMDDVRLAVTELADGIRSRLEFKKTSIGFLLCDPDMASDDLVAGLAEELGIEIVGFTSMGIIADRIGLVDMAATLTVLTSDDVDFVTVTTAPLSTQNIAEEIRKAYRKGVKKLGVDPQLILAFPSYILEIMLDIYHETLAEVAPGIPVFGGVPSNDGSGGPSMIFADRRAFSDRMAIVLVAGEVKPVFTVQNVVTKLSEYKRTVTRSEGNVIYKVGDVTFVDFLRQFGLPVEQLAASSDDMTTLFVSNPILVEMKHALDDDGVAIARSIHEINLETGSGTAIGAVPEGATISVAALKGRDIEVSAQMGIDDIVKKIRENEHDGYVYSAIFCVSCVGRYLVMANKNSLESDSILNEIPPGIVVSGFYSFGEICPTSVRGGKAINRAHNESLTILAI